MSDFPAIRKLIAMYRSGPNGEGDRPAVRQAWAEYEEAIQLRAERDQQERFKWEANRRADTAEAQAKRLGAALEALAPHDPDPDRHDIACPAHTMHEGEPYAGGCDCHYSKVRHARAVLTGRTV